MISANQITIYVNSKIKKVDSEIKALACIKKNVKYDGKTYTAYREHIFDGSRDTICNVCGFDSSKGETKDAIVIIAVVSISVVVLGGISTAVAVIHKKKK